MKKNKKMKNLFEKVKTVNFVHRNKFIAEWYFMSKLSFKLKMDLEIMWQSGFYDE